MKLPDDFLASLDGLPGFDREPFVAVHEAAAPPTSVRFNPVKSGIVEGTERAFFGGIEVSLTPVDWCGQGYYLSTRPSFTFDPLFHAGSYYVQEASSMFLEQPFRQLLSPIQPIKVLDLCAAPGGKTTHIQSLLPAGSLLVSNEVIRPRSAVLVDNVQRWGSNNVFVTNNDPKAFAALPGYFDVIVVDAPCSGSGLFRKDEDAMNEWNLHNVALCSQRQRRILSDALPALKEGGLLVYSTCSYSAEEDEQIMDWLATEMGFVNETLRVADFEGVVAAQSASGSEGYRFYPDKIAGEGFFLCCFRKPFAENTGRLRMAKPVLLSAKEKTLLESWVDGEGLFFLRLQQAIFGLPSAFLSDFTTFQSVLNLRYAGIQVGEIMREKLIPHHALAQSRLLLDSVPAHDLTLDEAIRYLQRKDLALQTAQNGWQVVRYAGQNLGWINALTNRINNYYPKEIRILKQSNEEPFKN